MIDNQINNLEFELYRIKTIINSDIYPLTNQEYINLLNERIGLKTEMKRLKKIKERREKIIKIKNK